MVEVANDLATLYDGYFPDDPWESRKNALARDSVDAIVRLAGNSLGSVVDVGAGR